LKLETRTMATESDVENDANAAADDGVSVGGYTPPSLPSSPLAASSAAAVHDDASPSPPFHPLAVEKDALATSPSIVEGDGHASDIVVASSAPAPSAPSSAIGLFAGLSLSSPPGRSAAVAVSDVVVDDISRAPTPVHSNVGDDPDMAELRVASGSRPPTPVHSNASPPTSPAGRGGTVGSVSSSVIIPPPPFAIPPPAGGGGPGATTRVRLHTMPSTKIPHPDTALRLLRKFHARTSPSLPKMAGGTRPSSWFGWVFGNNAETVTDAIDDDDLDAYREFSLALGMNEVDDPAAYVDGGDGGTDGGDGVVVVESILGRRGDTPARARASISTFVQLLGTWCKSSADVANAMEAIREAGGSTNGKSSASGAVGEVTSDLLAMCIDAASSLVAHGCLDDVYLRLGAEEEEEEEGQDGDRNVDDVVGQGEEDLGAPSLIKLAVNMLVESVCIADLSSERTELSALKFLLTTGCRVAVGEPMIHGTHLLQTVRVCSQIYLHTDVGSNKTTAKAALQQLVVTVFVRLERSIERCILEERMAAVENVDVDREEGGVGGRVRRSNTSSSDAAAPSFPTQDHRDAYLVLRSLCKLSMQTSTSRAPATVVMSSVGGGGGAEVGSNLPLAAAPTPSPVIHPPLDSSYDPALESRILALELLLHILRHSSSLCLLNAGPHFHYAIRQYLCTSLLKNSTSLDTNTVELSLRLFVPLIRNFRSLLKTEIEAFVTNVFFVILDSKNSTIQHKLLVVTLFEEICADATTLAEIFLNYDCDLSAVDLFSRIVNALGKVARVGLADATGSSGGGAGGGAAGSLQFVAGAGAVRAEMTRLDHRELRLAAMKALRQVLASLHSSIVTPVNGVMGDSCDISLDEASLRLKSMSDNGDYKKDSEGGDVEAMKEGALGEGSEASAKKTLVEMYDSKKKRREEEAKAALKFNQKPQDGLKYAAERGHLDITDPVDVARYLLQNKDIFEKAQIGEYLGREKEWQDGFALKVLRAYGDALDFQGMKFDDAIRYYLSGFRLPGEAQKIDRIMEVFAARYTEQNSSVFPTADSAFILAFSIIMLNTDLHNPAIREDRRMTIPSFIRMNSGVCEGGDFPDEMLAEIFERIKNDPISLKEDDNARESAGIGKGGKNVASMSTTGLSDFFFGSHYVEQDKTRESNYQKEGDQIVRDTESMLRRRRKATKHHAQSSSASSGSKKSLRDSLKKNAASVKFVGTADSGLRDEYVTPMFDVAWGPALAVFSTAIESANGTDGILASIATDEEMDHAVENAALAIDVSLNGFQLAICIAGLCGNDTARDAYVRALYNFTLLGSSHLLADRHIHCVRALLRLGMDDGELLGVTWEHIFRALTDIYRLHQVWEGMARNERKESKARERAVKKAQRNSSEGSQSAADDESDTSSEMSDYIDVRLEEEMDKRMIDEANAMFVHNTISLDLVDSIFQRSTSLSRRSLKDFVYQLCRVSRMEISGYGGHVGSNANDIDLTNDHYMKHHTLSDTKHGSTVVGVSATQPAIYSLEKLVEVTHFNMESRPRLIFADIWGTISTHLTSTALHEEAAVAMYAVDSLRQLSLQFLNREELGVFEFQRRFLKPFETIMSRSTHVSVKELLLSSVEQIISIYGFGNGLKSTSHHGTLRSGWRSVLIVLGTAGLDKDDSIAFQGFKMLSDQIDQCLSGINEEVGDVGSERPETLLAEYYVDLVNTLLFFVSGPRQDLSTKSTVRLLQLSGVLAEGKVPQSYNRKKAPASSIALPASSVEAAGDNGNMGLWWPMLLGLSQTMGDPRPDIRVKGLGTLLDIINKHFFPSSGGAKLSPSDDDGCVASPQHGDLQTLQLIFRGILVPALEFEEIDGNSTSGFAPELLPPKLVHFITLPPAPDAAASGAESRHNEWINTTFEYLIDGCVSICLRSLKAFNSDFLVEEVLAMLNSCLLSDSGHLAVKGLRRLLQFVTQDLELKDVSDDTWATVSHMLSRVLSIRGLPPSLVPEVEGASDEQKDQVRHDHTETMNEFIREQRYFSNRRYIGCNAAMVIGSLLTDEKIFESMGMQWFILLTSGLGKGIKEWERAAEIIDSKTTRPDIFEAKPSP
jgi:Sec7-like guanine-nucleotide exchange factor